MQIDFSTEGIRQHQQFDTWRSQLLFEIGTESLPPDDTAAPFNARFSARSGGPLLNVQYRADAHRVIRTESHVAQRHWNSYWIYREDSPGAWFRMNGEEFVTHAGDLVIADADVTFETMPSAFYSHELWLIPKPLLDPHLPALHRPLLTTLSGHAGAPALAASYLASLTERWDELPDSVMGPVADTLCRLIGIACGAIIGGQPDALRAGRLTEAKRYIDRHLSDPALSPASAAAALGLSVRSLHALFEPAGSSFTRHVQRRRLEECRAALLANPSRAVTDVAFAWGFGSLSSFYRAFQAAFGETPGDARIARCGP